MHLLSAEELPYDPNQVTPGVIGFAVTALLAIVVMLLLWDFNRRVRRINDREDVQLRLAAEVAAAEAERSGGAASAGHEVDLDGPAATTSTASPTEPEPPRAPRG